MLVFLLFEEKHEVICFKETCKNTSPWSGNFLRLLFNYFILFYFILFYFIYLFLSWTQQYFMYTHQKELQQMSTAILDPMVWPMYFIEIIA